jgi:hypothetical protein
MSKSFDQFRRDNIVTTLPTTLEYGKEVYYKDASGNLTLYVGDENGAGQPSVGGAKPERVVYVYGTADDVAPNFTTVAGAITYANSLAPDPGNEPVVIRLFAKTDNTPYDLTGLSTWTTYANNGIYFVSDFVRLNETTTLPTTLPPGQQVWYIDPNGVETLWVGREDGTAWPAVGYKEYVATVSFEQLFVQEQAVSLNTIGPITFTQIPNSAVYEISGAGEDASKLFLMAYGQDTFGSNVVFGTITSSPLAITFINATDGVIEASISVYLRLST